MLSFFTLKVNTKCWFFFCFCWGGGGLFCFSLGEGGVCFSPSTCVTNNSLIKYAVGSLDYEWIICRNVSSWFKIRKHNRHHANSGCSYGARRILRPWHFHRFLLVCYSCSGWHLFNIGRVNMKHKDSGLTTATHLKCLWILVLLFFASANILMKRVHVLCKHVLFLMTRLCTHLAPTEQLVSAT